MSRTSLSRIFTIIHGLRINMVLALLVGAILMPRPSEAQPASFSARWGEFNTEIGNLSLLLGIEKGLFKTEGVDLRLSVFSGGPPKMAAAAAGSIDMGTIGPPGLVAFSRGARIRFVSAAWTSVPYFFLVVRPGIQEISALRGRRIAINNPGSGYDLALRAMLSSHGLNPATDVSIVALGSDLAAFAAFEKAHIDAVVAKEPLVVWPKRRDSVAYLRHRGTILRIFTKPVFSRPNLLSRGAPKHYGERFAGIGAHSGMPRTTRPK